MLLMPCRGHSVFSMALDRVDMSMVKGLDALYHS